MLTDLIYICTVGLDILTGIYSGKLCKVRHLVDVTLALGQAS